MITIPKLGAWLATAVLTVVCAPQAWAAGSSSSASAVSATSAKAVVSASSSAIPEALQKALAQSEGKERDKAVMDAAVEWQKSDPAAALAWVAALPEIQSNRGLVSAVSTAWAKRDPAAATAACFAWAKKQNTRNGFSLLALHMALCPWARSDPKAAVAWSDTVPADSSEAIMFWIYFSIADGWAQADPAASAAWAETVKNDKNREVAIKEAAQMFIKYKPAGAPAWAEHLPLADLKIAVVPIFIILRQHDAAKATAWLDSLNLPDEMKAELKKPKK